MYLNTMPLYHSFIARQLCIRTPDFGEVMMKYIYVTFIGLYYYIFDVRWLVIQDQSLCDTIN